MDANYYSYLLELLQEGKLSPAQTEELVDWLGKERADLGATELIMSQLSKPVTNSELNPEIREALVSRLQQILVEPDQKQPRIPVMMRRSFRYAAAVLVLLGLTIGFIIFNRSAETPSLAINEEKSTPDNIVAGKDGAILTLADGSKMTLDSLGNGVIAMQNGAKVSIHNGKLIYNSSDAAIDQIAYNTISTPRGRQFQLVLPDQTKVWLNAASSLKYPITFSGSERKVEVTGEAYFEVAKNPKMPFRVQINNETTVEVLGTHFNINSYQNESDIKTTLLEGSVKIISNGESALIKPGQQAKVERLNITMPNSNHIEILKAVNVDKVMAWKNGVFDFEDATLEEVMRQLERWYDIEVVYEKNIPKMEFLGKMGRDLNLSGVMRGLEINKVHCRLEGRKLIVMP